MSNRTARWLVAVLSLAASGCQPTLQDGRFTCTVDSDCPDDFACRASDMLCYRAGSDAGVPVDAQSAPDAANDAAIDDAGPSDGGSSDAGSSDAGSDASTGCGTNCIQLMILNADPTQSGSISYEDNDLILQRISIPPYGTTSAVVDVPNVPVGGNLRVNVPPTITFFHTLPIPDEGRYLLVLGPGSVGASVLLLRSDPELLHTDNYVYIRLIDMVADSTSGLIARGAGRMPAAQMLPNPFEDGTISAVLPFLPNSTGALRLELDRSPATLIAALLADRIPAAEGTYYVVVAGEVGKHLDTADGLRFIPGLPGATARRSSRIVRFLNTLGRGMTICDGAMPVAMVGPRALSPARVPPGSGPWMLTVRASSDCSTGVVQDVTVGAAVGRTLVSIAGDGAGVWRAESIAEPMPTVGLGTIVFHNGLATPSDIQGAIGVPSLGTASINVTTAPTSITATTTDGPQEFSWIPTSRQSWGVITRAAGVYGAVEVDSPFDAPWTVALQPSL